MLAIKEYMVRQQYRPPIGFIRDILCVGCLLVIAWLLLPSSVATPADNRQQLHVYCAIGLQKPIVDLAARFSAQHPVDIHLHYGSSGQLAQQLRLEQGQAWQRCDVYIPADHSFATQTQQLGLTTQSTPLAQLQLVLASKSPQHHALTSINQLLASPLRWTLCEPSAGIGAMTQATLEPIGQWENFYRGAKTTFGRVTEAAQAIAHSNVIDVGFIWANTAHQFGLHIYDLPELNNAYAAVSANITSASSSVTEAEQFIKFLNAPDNESVWKQHWLLPSPAPATPALASTVNQHGPTASS